MGSSASESTTNTRKFINHEIFGGRPNIEILGLESGHSKCSSPKLYELKREATPRFGIARFQPLTAQSFITCRQSLHRSLDPCCSDPALHDVYVVMKHDITHRGTTQCRRHVSIYCNGFYYHLSAPDRQGAQIGPKINGSRTVLKVTEYSDFESEAHRQLGKHPGPVLVGYHVGQTDYDPEQIQTLSEWIIENLGIYNFFSNNCQHFVFCLLSRIICRGRRDTVFMGSMKQIATLAAQAQRGELMLFKNGFYEGFCLSGQDCAQAPLYSKLPRLWTSENKWYEHPGTALKYMYHWGKWVRSNQRMDLTAHQLCVLWNQGQMGLLPNNILEYSAWRRQLLFPTVTRRFPKMRLLLLKSGSYPEDK